MSGGSWDYLYSRLEDPAYRLLREPAPERRALGALLLKISKAMHAIEWVDSGDYGEGDDLVAIEAVIGPHGRLEQIVRDAEAVLKQLTAELAKVQK